MNAGKPARNPPYPETADPSVDELLDELGDSSGQADGIRKRLGEEAVETSQDERTEDLIAPEVLFPDEAAESG